MSPELISLNFEVPPPGQATAEDDEADDEVDEDCEAVQERLEHMLEASRHLELAGMKDEAQELREKCVADVSELMRRLKAAEAELARLRGPASKARQASLEVAPPAPAPTDSGCKKKDDAKQVVVNLQMLELDLMNARQTAVLLGNIEKRFESHCEYSAGDREEPYPFEKQLVEFLAYRIYCS